MPAPRGPGSSFECLFEQAGEGLPLPADLQAIYGRWPLPHGENQPYTYVNFVTSRDGRISFNEPLKTSGGPISGNNQHDRWLMALLRARADAVLIGGSALEYAPRQTWNAASIFPADGAAWAALRDGEGRRPVPLHVVVTRTGEIWPQSPVIQDPEVPAIVVSGDDGLRRAQDHVATAPNVEFFSTGPELDFKILVRRLGDVGIKTLLSEAGPRVYGAMLAAGIVVDEFLTLSPIVAGSSPTHWRPGLVEGVAFAPDDPPRSRLLAVFRSGDHLFLHSRYKDA